MIKSLALSLLFCCFALFAADVNGKYKASIEAPDGTHVLIFNLKTDGGNLTGTVSNESGSADAGGSKIDEGKVQGDTITFSWVTMYQGGPIKLVCKGQVAGSEIKMSMGTEDGSWSTELTAKKAD